MGNWKDHLKRAIDHLGSQPKLADAMKRVGAETCSQSKISWLLQHGKTIAAEDALAVHRATDGFVSASDLRPDLWQNVENVPAEIAEAS